MNAQDVSQALLPVFFYGWLVGTPLICWVARKELTGLGLAYLPVASALFLLALFAFITHAIGALTVSVIEFAIIGVMSRFSKDKAHQQTGNESTP